MCSQQHVLQREWQQFLKVVDRSFTASITETVLHVGDDGPIDTPLVDIRSDTPVTLRHYSGAGPLLVVLMRHFA